MSVYVDYDGSQVPLASTTVHENTRTARVTYRNERGDRFRVNVVQRPNAIGFTARLPGDRKRSR
jgi:hypothetical protein